MSDGSTNRLHQMLAAYGVSKTSLRLFRGSATPDLVEYLDLLPSSQFEAGALTPDGVAESQGRPLLYVVNETQPASAVGEQEIRRLRKSLACRGNRAYLARIQPGKLLVTPVRLEDRRPNWREYHAGSGESLTFFSRLAQGHYDGKGQPTDANDLFRRMSGLLNRTATDLMKLLGPADVFSLIGRVLFFRFLRDRKIVSDRDTKHIAPSVTEILACFDGAESAHAACQWLDKTFNGDFLPLSDGGSHKFFSGLAKHGPSAFVPLKAIMRGWDPAGKSHYQKSFDWNQFDFAHIPVGLLSQVYEAFCWEWEPKAAKSSSVHYTPRNIAATLVDEVFDGVPNADRCHVLDPACGAGVFLVLAFRRLYREKWQATGQRPDTREIREILEAQIVGFDISDSALKLAALSLYLTAIELDPKPIPPAKLRFNPLHGSVLFNHRRREDSHTGFVIGSLGPHVSGDFLRRFDIILGNPPWTSLDKDQSELANQLNQVSKAVICDLGGEGLAAGYENPDRGPDLPVLWKSSQWCKPGGRIAMALPARILLKQEDIPRRARETLFRLIEVTGIINGTNLAGSGAWPGMNQPFVLVFARNRRPRRRHLLQLITPYFESELNQKGEMRIDAKSAISVDVDATTETPWAWKALSVGTALDIDVIHKLRSSSPHSLQQYWSEDLKLPNGNGYQVASKQKQQDASFLRGLPDLNSTELFRFLVRVDHLESFKKKTLVRTRGRLIYYAPLVLVNVTPGERREDGRALLSLADVAYNESFYGYSGHGFEDGELLVRYLHLFVHSSIWTHYTLLTSGEFGAERRKFQKSDLDGCPIVPLDKLTVAQRNEAMALSNRLVRGHGSGTIFADIDAFFCKLYRLKKLDLEVIEDTLEVAMPFERARTRACSSPSGSEKESFRRRLESLLRPFFRATGRDVKAALARPGGAFLPEDAPFSAILVADAGQTATPIDSLLQDMILALADDTGTTLIIQYLRSSLLLGILNQYRYWTPSRARLLAAEIVREHMGVFEG